MKKMGIEIEYFVTDELQKDYGAGAVLMEKDHNKIIIPIVEIICKSTEEEKHIPIRNLHRSNPDKETLELIDDRDYGGYGG